jgi:multiple sugar transport system substrate-binding protein
MKKILIILILLVGFSFNSCKNKEATNPNVIKFWHFWSEPNQKKALLDLIAKFEKENNCKVELTELSWNDGKTKLITAFNSEVAPDVLELGSDWVAQFSSTGILSQINPDSVDFSQFLEYSLPPAKWNNQYFAVPWIVDSRVMFYNKKLLNDAGLTEIPLNYSELISAANNINASEKGIYGFGTNGSDPHRLYKKVLPIIWTNGGDILDSSGFPVINSNKNIAALDIYLQLSRTGLIETQRQIDAYFSQGKIGFVFSGAWLLEKIKNENPNLDFGVALMPNFNENKDENPKGNNKGNQGISFLGCEYLALNKNSTKKELGLKLVKFLANGENSLELSKKFAEAGFPADKKYFNDISFKNDKYKSVFAAQLLNSKATPVHPNWLEIEEILENAVSQALYGEKGVDAALNDAQVELLKLFSEKVN